MRRWVREMRREAKESGLALAAWAVREGLSARQGWSR